MTTRKATSSMPTWYWQALTPYPPRPSAIFDKLQSYAPNHKKTTRVVFRAPEGLTPLERKQWHKLRKAGAL